MPRAKRRPGRTDTGGGGTRNRNVLNNGQRRRGPRAARVYNTPEDLYYISPRGHRKVVSAKAPSRRGR